MSLFVLLAGCTENGFSQLNQDDFFQQNRINTVDVLIVVDNSCSMAEEQNKLAVNFDGFIQFFEEAEVDWQIGVVTTDTVSEGFQGRLIGGDDEIQVVDPTGEVVDEVHYSIDWPVASGVVFSLDPSWNATIRNDDLDHWCILETATPGEPNPSCAAESGDGSDDRYGAIVITEFLPDPEGVEDSLGEWVEITNISEEEISLDGWLLKDTGKNQWSFPAGVVIAPGAALVLARDSDSSINGGIENALALGADFSLNNHDLFLSNSTEGAAEIFAENVAQGTTGAGIEMGLEAVRQAIEEQAEYNAGFLREEANLSVLIVSDEEDSSPLSVDAYLRSFADAKGGAYRDHARMNVSGVVGDTPPEFDGEPSCSSDNGYADYGSRYVYAAQTTGGLVDSICDEDFSPIVAELGLTLSGLLVEFQLSRVPDLATLTVSIYDSPDESSKVKDLTLDVDFTYVEENNSILFEKEQIPNSQQYIKVSYRIKSGA
jgi:hypothetical protein